MKDPIYILLNKYFNENITAKEWQQLQELLPTIPDELLSSILSTIWEESESKDKEMPVRFEELNRKLRGDNKVQMFPNYRKILKIAAIITIPLLVGTQYFLFTENKELNQFLSKEMTVKVKSGEKAEVELPDGTKVSLNSATSISYSSDFGKENREIKLNGEAFLKVAKDSLKPFIVHTSDVQIKVLGTTFNVNAYENTDHVETTLLEGSVKISPNGNLSKSLILTPNNKAIYHKDTKELQIEKANLKFETAWMNNELVFRSVSFKDMIQTIERHFGYHIIVEGNKYSQDHFTGSFSDKRIEKVLKTLRLHYDFEYKIEEEQVKIKFN